MATGPLPTPTVKVFTFRYQYLLIEVGTSILRNVFDRQVGPGDFKLYIDTHNGAKAQLQFLINTKKLTTVQQKLIPPLNNTPSSSNFDITLLCCLLRNACGLRVCSDPVWLKPLKTDTSVEALITKLKDCRNNLLHSGSVFDSETDLKAKWAELCSILTGLGNFCGMTNIQSLIDKADTVDIDEKIKEQFDNMMRAWVEMDRLFDHGIGEVIEGQERLEKNLSQEFENMKKGQQKCIEGQESLGHRLDHFVKETQKRNFQLDSIEQSHKRQKMSDEEQVKKDIQQQLIDVYQEDCFKLPMSPILNDEDIELLKIYKIPSLSVVDYHKAKPDQKSTEVKSCKDIFCQDDQQCRKIYITGDVGVGKSSFCTYLALLWSMSRKGNKISNDKMQKDANFLTKFEYLFYVRLRDTARTDVRAIIVEQLFNTESQEKWNEMYKLVETLMKCHESLVILDGLDEWSPTPKTTDKRNFKIPYRPTSEKCTYLTTCRPYKIENVRLANKDLDRQVKMTGLHGSSMKSYIADIVKYINEKYPENKKEAYDFFIEAEQCGLDELLCIPIITSNLVMIWLEQPLTDMSRSIIYGNNVEMLFKIAKDRKIEFPSTSSSPSSSPGVQLPDSLSGLVHLREHFTLLEKVCLLSFRSLFKQDDCVTNLIFSPQQLMSEPYFMSSNEQDFLCKIGILSKNKVTRQVGKQEHKLSFLHKSYLEFFAAIFVSSYDASKLLNICNNFTTIGDVLKFGSFFLFLAGCSPRKLELVFEEINKLISEDITSCRTNAIFHYERRNTHWHIKSLQETVINCFKECCKCSPNEDVNLKHEDFVFDGFSDDVDNMKKLLLMNTVKSLQSGYGEYLDVFNDIKTLECLDVGACLNMREFVYDNTELMDQNASEIIELMGQNVSELIELMELLDQNASALTELTEQNASELTELMEQNASEIIELMGQNVSELIELMELLDQNASALTELTEQNASELTELMVQNAPKFTELMVQNASTLHTVCFAYSISNALMVHLSDHVPLVPAIPVGELHHLTSLSLSCVTMHHNSLHNLVTFLSSNVNMENISLSDVNCADHFHHTDMFNIIDSDDDSDDDSKCPFTLNLHNLPHLVSLCLVKSYIVCNNLNNSSLKSIRLEPISERNASSYGDLFNCVKDSHLEHLYISGRNRDTSHDDITMKALTSALNTLPCIKLLELRDMNLPDEAHLQLSPDITQWNVKLSFVTMSRQYFRRFIESCINTKGVKVCLLGCSITSDDGDTHRKLSDEVNYMYEYLTSIPTINITHKGNFTLYFERRLCQ